MKKLTDPIYMLACASFLLMVGAGLYETVTLVPVWTAAPPASLTMFQGAYAIDYGVLWKRIDPITLVLLLAALLLNWKHDRRKNILIVLGGYVVIMIVTFAYFVPEIIYFTTYPYQNTVIGALKDRADLWGTLSRIRLLCMFGLSFVLLSGLTKKAEAYR